MLKKPLLIATISAAVAMTTISTNASAGDPVLGALIGGGIGAAIGHDVNRRNGAALGGVLGAIVGSSIAADSGPRYYDRGYSDRSYYDPSYGYATAPVYVAPAPVVIYRSGRYYNEPRYTSRHDRRDWRDYRRIDDRRWR